jgi:hypothetical protein
MRFGPPGTWAGPRDEACRCGCGRIFRVTEQNPRQAYFSDTCRARAQNARSQARRDRTGKKRVRRPCKEDSVTARCYRDAYSRG